MAANPFDEFDAKPEVNPFDEFDTKATPASVLKRVESDVKQAGYGVGDAGANLLGLPGDLQKILPDWLKGGPFADKPPTTEDVKNFASDKTGLTMPSPDTPEGGYLRAGTQGVASMLSPNKGAMLTGLASGLMGEKAERMEPGMRVVGNLLGLGPSTMLSGAKPWDVRALGDWVERMGKGAVNSGGAAAADAAKYLKMGTTNLASQVPQLQPLMKYLQRLKSGQPIDDLAQQTTDALVSAKPVMPGTRNWGPDGWENTAENVANVAEPLANTTPLPGILPSVRKESAIGAKSALLGLVPGKYGEGLSKFFGSMGQEGRLSDLTKKLTSPGAADYLLNLANAPGSPKRVIAGLVQALTSMDLQREQSPLRIDITGGQTGSQ